MALVCHKANVAFFIRREYDQLSATSSVKRWYLSGPLQWRLRQSGLARGQANMLSVVG
jgi:hypothetical protein